MSEDDKSELAREREALDNLHCALDQIAKGLPYYWHWGDGCGGFVLDLLRDKVNEAGLPWPWDPVSREAPKGKKAVISRSLAKQVFERDAYRCRSCGSHHDLTCDHVLPESAGGPTALENLQTLCRSCNSRKGITLP